MKLTLVIVTAIIVIGLVLYLCTRVSTWWRLRKGSGSGLDKVLETRAAAARVAREQDHEIKDPLDGLGADKRRLAEQLRKHDRLIGYKGRPPGRARGCAKAGPGK